MCPPVLVPPATNCEKSSVATFSQSVDPAVVRAVMLVSQPLPTHSSASPTVPAETPR